MDTRITPQVGPRLTIITPNYNHGHLVADAIQSVAQQTRPALEHIVVDDASTDNSVDVLRSMERDNPHLRVFTSVRNGGPIAACGRALAEARGELVMWLAADDVLLPGALASLLRVFDANPDAVLVTGDVRFVSVSNGSTWTRRYSLAAEPRYYSPAALVANQRKSVSMINGAATVVRRDAAIQGGIHETGLRWLIDWFAFNTVAYRYGLWYVPQVVHEFRLTPGSYSSKSRDWAVQVQVLDRVFELLDSPDYSDVRACFRDSGVLSYMPKLAAYMLRSPAARAFATRHLMRNLVLIAGYRASTRIIPRPVLETVIRLKAALAAPGALSRPAAADR